LLVLVTFSFFFYCIQGQGKLEESAAKGRKGGDGETKEVAAKGKTHTE